MYPTEELIKIITLACIGSTFGTMYIQIFEKQHEPVSISHNIFKIIASGLVGFIVAALLSYKLFDNSPFVTMMLSCLFGFMGNERTIKFVSKWKIFKNLFDTKSEKEVKPNQIDTNNILKDINFSLQNLSIECKYFFKGEYNTGHITTISTDEFTLNNGFQELRSLDQSIEVDFSSTTLPFKELSCPIKSNSVNSLLLSFPKLSESSKQKLLKWIISKAIMEVNKLPN